MAVPTGAGCGRWRLHWALADLRDARHDDRGESRTDAHLAGGFSGLLARGGFALWRAAQKTVIPLGDTEPGSVQPDARRAAAKTMKSRPLEARRVCVQLFEALDREGQGQRSWPDFFVRSCADRFVMKRKLKMAVASFEKSATPSLFHCFYV